MDWNNLPSDPHAGEGWPHYEYEEKLENENKRLKETIEVYEQILDNYGILEAARLELKDRVQA